LEHFSRLKRFLDNKSGSNTEKRRKYVSGLAEEELRRGQCPQGPEHHPVRAKAALASSSDLMKHLSTDKAVENVL
jgi:hypothetical protein